jgi:hypothetical protein
MEHIKAGLWIKHCWTEPFIEAGDFVTFSMGFVKIQVDFENDRGLAFLPHKCHGWIKSEVAKVTVRIEPLRQPSRLAAQQQFCRKLTGLRVITPSGKLLEIEVGDSPIR